ncbi:hypothetical protein DY000_02039571 [Brassica cretica]|uniref:Uncharacterized protein n=1 Tax=Brassica cretica TaxID=69181 RepID=A0ABQ7BE17_BRACR|nr:hypothetical protein DY000_02039571 [Brassica cretica]
MFTGKRPTDELFGGYFTLHGYIKSALPERVFDIADKSIFHNGLRVGFPIAVCRSQILEVGFKCCQEPRTNRIEASLELSNGPFMA